MPYAFFKKGNHFFFFAFQNVPFKTSLFLKSHRLLKIQAKNEKLKYFLTLLLSAKTKPEALKYSSIQIRKQSYNNVNLKQL